MRNTARQGKREMKREREEGENPSGGDRLLGRIMRTNANSRSLRCGQAFICHALAAVYSRGQYGTYAIRRLRVVPHSQFLFLLGHLRVVLPFLTIPIPSRFLLPRISERPRRPCTLPQLSATVISRGYFCSRIALPPSPHAAVACTFLLIMQPYASRTLTI